MLEAEFQDTVADAARVLGWFIYHARPARTAKGWRTSVSYDGKGFPDLVAVRERVLFIELKSSTGSMSAEQKVWRVRLKRAGAEYHLWTPDTPWDEIVGALTVRATA
ncbi:MAG: VRR-NUC domain-containing protein [Parcubacteria group bacterium]